MKKKKIRAIQYGVGPIGAAIVRLLREKNGVEEGEKKDCEIGEEEDREEDQDKEGFEQGRKEESAAVSMLETPRTGCVKR